MLRRPPWGASHSQRSPWLLLHAVEACQLTVFTAELLDGGAMRPTPLFTYRLPARTLPGSLSLGQHAIFCACDAGEGEGVDEPSQPLSSHSQLLVLSRTELAESDCECEEPGRGRGVVAGGGAVAGAGARHSRAAHAAVLQSLPMPSGVVMFVAPLGECPVAGTTALPISSSALAAAPLGVCLVATRSALYSLRMHRRPERVCRRLLRPLRPSSLGAALGSGSSSAVGFEATAASARVAHASLLARSFGLDVSVLFARAAAEALVNVPLHATSAPDGSLEATSTAAALLSARPAAALDTLKLLAEMGRLLEHSAMQVPLPPDGEGYGASSRAWTDSSTRAWTRATAAARDASSSSHSQRSVAAIKPVAPLLSDVAVRALWPLFERGFMMANTMADAPPAIDCTGHSAPFAPSTPSASPVDARAPSPDAAERSTPSLERRRRDAAASQRRLALIRLCCALHARLLLRGSLPMLTSGTKTAVRADVYAAAAPAEAAADAAATAAAAAAAAAAPLEEAAHAALVAAPADAARILALCGYWWLVLTPALVPPTTARSPTTARRSTTAHDGALEPNTALSPSAPPMPSLRARLRWLREAAARGTLQPAERRTPPAEWSRLLRACMQEDSSGRGYTSDTSSDAGDGAPESDAPMPPAAFFGLLASVATREGNDPNMDDPNGRFPNMDDQFGRFPNMDDPDGATASDVADACLLLRLALLPPPPALDALDAACALGAQLEPFVRWWLSAGWPRRPLIAALRGRMLVAAPAVCWLLEHRPALMAKAALGPELLLDCIRVVATVGEESSRVG